MSKASAVRPRHPRASSSQRQAFWGKGRVQSSLPTGNKGLVLFFFIITLWHTYVLLVNANIVKPREYGRVHTEALLKHSLCLDLKVACNLVQEFVLEYTSVIVTFWTDATCSWTSSSGRPTSTASFVILPSVSFVQLHSSTGTSTGCFGAGISSVETVHSSSSYSSYSSAIRIQCRTPSRGAFTLHVLVAIAKPHVVQPLRERFPIVDHVARRHFLRVCSQVIKWAFSRYVCSLSPPPAAAC